ncbi:UvrD-helicase domain-containing protein [Bradyrhizobium sp. Arg237L]|uniref:UvrD-helicase domain-containing protein n=1 Tax=Bradyrhizobium sp. Arg237L TaxID=3003352 RepID=UPI00249DF59B|nr:UvrD-helicase domain-containing protein [Bradyrhizobium sp. Arg237L]MDI4237499.1 UvrD-helicase domain-containing protein [Bradyrhizobium sp. Arg237L]
MTAMVDDAERLRALTDLDSCLLVEAAAGTGKTSLLAGRVVMLLAAGVDPKSIAAITFTELAAGELRQRIASNLDCILSLPAMACVSAMQKAIRRSMEREAMEFACELMHTSKAFHAMVCNRLEIICHEDFDTLAAPWVVPFVAFAQSKERYSKSIGEARLIWLAT